LWISHYEKRRRTVPNGGGLRFRRRTEPARRHQALDPEVFATTGSQIICYDSGYHVWPNGQKHNGTDDVTRRMLLRSFPQAYIACDAIAQTIKPPIPRIPVRSLLNVSLTVSDLKRSLEFYQGLFGMPIQQRQGNTGIILKVGPGPQGLGLFSRQSSGVGHAPEASRIARVCFSTGAFNPERLSRSLNDYGIRQPDHGGAGEPLRAWVDIRREDKGGAKGGTPEIYCTDPDGITIQLQDVSYCGGAGHLGNLCRSPDASRTAKGRFIVRDLNHVSIKVSNLKRSLNFYQGLFGIPIQHEQGSTTISLRIGAGPQAVGLFVGGNDATGGTPGNPNIAHVCLAVDDFNPDRVMKTLADYGVKPRGTDEPGRPLTSIVRMRMEDHGGAKSGTPELYFTDPDGITIQLQDASYCGGAGYLGNVCG
jgi:catechol 2,3-dioxygenase-like lactoylglutathione lyase family enzyme